MTADIRDRLRQLTEAREKATPGPWAQHPVDPLYVIGEVSDDGESYLDVADTVAAEYPDAAAIVAAHNAVPWLVAALTAVLDLADELEREAGERDAIAGRLPNTRDYHMEINRLVVAAAHQQRGAKRIRAVVAAAGDQP